MADIDLSSEIDPDGAMGVIAAPTWSARWSGLNLSDLEACFKNAAECAALSLNQMEQLLQGLPPERSTWPHLRTCLSGCKVAIRDLRFDLANETLPRPVSPPQFLAWCTDRQHELPDPFIERVLELKSIAPSHQGAPKNVMTASIWGQLVASVPAATLQAFYDSVKMRAEGIDSSAGKQKIVVELYDKFFRNAYLLPQPQPRAFSLAGAFFMSGDHHVPLQP